MQHARQVFSPDFVYLLHAAPGRLPQHAFNPEGGAREDEQYDGQDDEYADGTAAKEPDFDDAD